MNHFNNASNGGVLFWVGGRLQQDHDPIGLQIWKTQFWEGGMLPEEESRGAIQKLFGVQTSM